MAEPSLLERAKSGVASFLAGPLVSVATGINEGIDFLRGFSSATETAESGRGGVTNRPMQNQFRTSPQARESRGQESERTGRSDAELIATLADQGIFQTGAMQRGGSTSEGNMLTPFIPLGQQALRSVQRNLPNIIGGGAIGLGATQLMDMGQQMPMKRITRKFRSQLRTLYNMSGGNLEATAQLASGIFGFQMSAEFVGFVLMKRFRNDGALVTKAAMRKTKKTLNALKRADDLLKMARPAPARRRTGVTQRVTKVSA